MSDFININLQRYKANYLANQTETARTAKNNSNNKPVSPVNTGLVRHANLKNFRPTIPEKSYPDTQIMYSKIYNSLDKEGKTLLKELNKKGKLTSRNSNDGSSTIENLYTILEKPRLPYFEAPNLIKETLKIINDPYLITQNFGKIPKPILPKVLKTENEKLLNKIKEAEKAENYNPNDIADTYPIKKSDVLDIHSATCSAASIEFNLADKNPAEFARFIEGLTGPEKSVKTKVKYSALSPNMTESLNMLIDQNSEFKTLDWDKFEITIKPDENAYLRAQVQKNAREENTRSNINVLMQSALMQLGSRNTYNSLTDKRSKDVGGGQGLNQFEIAFVESIVDNSCKKIPLVYMELDNDLTKVLNYPYGLEKTKNHFINSLDMGKNIITGFLVDVDKNKNVNAPHGHEILLTGYKYDQNGELWFKYNDTDDEDHFEPSWMKAEGFLHKVHHANIPEKALQDKIEQPEAGYLYLQDYKHLKNQNKIKF